MAIIKIITPPATNTPVTVAEVKTQCRIDNSDHDTEVGDIVKRVAGACEAQTGRSLITQTLEIQLDAWPWHPDAPAMIRNAIVVPRPPVASITSVKYIDTDGVEQTLTVTTDYLVQIGDPRTLITPAPNTTWPALYPVPGAVKVRYVAGFGTASTDLAATRIGSELRAGMLQLADFFFSNHSDEISGTVVARFATNSQSIFARHAVGLFGYVWG